MLSLNLLLSIIQVTNIKIEIVKHSFVIPLEKKFNDGNNIIRIQIIIFILFFGFIL